jgi:hypothetical protein
MQHLDLGLLQPPRHGVQLTGEHHAGAAVLATGLLDGARGLAGVELQGDVELVLLGDGTGGLREA